ncbi:MAG: class I adenylate-forming enzyme family protein [Bacillota bacterium]|nr:class I adenylate-forming enzyme family protein [Bacillota bacterium]
MKVHTEAGASVVESIAHHAASRPDKLALADSSKSLTYGQLWSCLHGLSKKLKEAGVSKGTCVVVECNQSVDYMVCALAIQLLCGIFVPLEKNAAKNRILEIAGDTKAVLHIAKAPLSESESETAFLALDRACDFAEAVSAEKADSVPFPKKEDVAEILFSTGTTGKSKGIVLTHGNDMALAENVMYGVQMKPDNVELVPMPLSHSHGLRRTYANLVNGSSVVFVDGVTLLKKVFNLMDQYGVTAMDLSPSMLSIIFKLSKDRLGDYAHILDYIQLGSAPLAEEDKVHLSRILPNTRLYNFYGSTEAGCSCLLDFNSTSGKPGCIGKPAKNAHFIVVDEDRKEIASSPENLGFLASSGSINMKCYFNAPELTASAMADGFIYTKDLGYIDEDGYVYMLGRKDDVINYGGIKISPEEIESIVVQHPNIIDCACIPVKDALTGQAPKLFIVPENEADHDAVAFKGFLAENLDANKQPKYVELIEEIPRTFNGKIKRNVLMELS